MSHSPPADHRRPTGEPVSGGEVATAAATEETLARDADTNAAAAPHEHWDCGGWRVDPETARRWAAVPTMVATTPAASTRR